MITHAALRTYETTTSLGAWDWANSIVAVPTRACATAHKVTNHLPADFRAGISRTNLRREFDRAQRRTVGCLPSWTIFPGSPWWWSLFVVVAMPFRLHAT